MSDQEPSSTLLTGEPKVVFAVSYNDIIRWSTDKDFNDIMGWLTSQHDRGVDDSFYCNREAVEAAHKKRRLLVYVDGSSHQQTAVAFQLGGLVHPGILEVRRDLQRRGIGTALVQRCKELARQKDQYLLRIQCAPESSIPFWKKMGFELIRSDDPKKIAFCKLEKQLFLPAEGVDADVTISFLGEDETVYEVYKPGGMITPDDGLLYLEHQVSFFPDMYRDVRDTVVVIEVDGRTIFRDKAKRGFFPVGIQRCDNGWFIETIDTMAAVDHMQAANPTNNDC